MIRGALPSLDYLVRKGVGLIPNEMSSFRAGSFSMPSVPTSLNGVLSRIGNLNTNFPVTTEFDSLLKSGFMGMQAKVDILKVDFYKQQMLDVYRNSSRTTEIHAGGKLKSFQKVITSVIAAKASGALNVNSSNVAGQISNLVQKIGQI